MACNYNLSKVIDCRAKVSNYNLSKVEGNLSKVIVDCPVLQK
jgi:hypothetical protein